MNKDLNHIILKSQEENSGEKNKQAMLALFHQPDTEYELKDFLYNGLLNTEIKETLNIDIKKMFARLWAKVEKIEKPQTSKTIFLKNIVRIAAVLVVGLIIGFYISSIHSKTELVYYAAHSPRGSVSEMLLPDGSIIFLNADSKIKYSIEGEKGIREVFLDGEAWFDVAKNKKKPFVVHTDSYDVNVTGTRFNVKAYNSENEVTTTLEDGQVIIRSTENFRFGEDIILKPGEQIVLNKVSKEANVKTVNTKWYTSWKDNKLIFVNMNLKDLVVVLERKYGVDIEIKNKDILDLHFDGTIKNESIIEMIEIIKKTLPIDYKITGQKIEITNNKN